MNDKNQIEINKMCCMDMWNQIIEKLNKTHNVVGSCNQDISAYLVPNGTEDEITYHSKPMYSFRISDHWNWYSNVKKCSDPRYVQCKSLDMPWARKRPEEGKASYPWKGTQIAFFGKDGNYHCVYGEFFDRKTKTWGWMGLDVDDVLEMCEMWK